MTGEGASSRLFTESESAAILRRAAELEAAGQEPAVTGLSLDALEEIAASAGLDPLHVRAAAAELGSRPRDFSARFWSLGPTTVTRERVVSADVSPELWEEIASEIRAAFPDVGTTQLIGHSLEWTGQGDGTADQVTVRAQGGKVRIRAYSDFSRALQPLYPMRFVPAALCVVLGVAAGTVAGLPAAVGWLALSQWIARRICRSMVRRRDERASALLSRLQELLSSTDAEREAVATALGANVPTVDSGAPERSQSRPAGSRRRSR